MGERPGLVAQIKHRRGRLIPEEYVPDLNVRCRLYRRCLTRREGAGPRGARPPSLITGSDRCRLARQGNS